MTKGTDTPRRLDAAWLSQPPLATLLEALDSEGEEARVVGGAVRNTLLGEPIGDIDIATTALPDETMRRAAALDFKPVPTGIAHGTITVVAQGRPYEVTTLRTDVETFGRHASVAFGRDWEADAKRRDFTVNALSATRDGRVHDYVGGLADIAARQVRFIGDPMQRIAEDYLRILRFFRFHAVYGTGAIDAAGLHACIVSRVGLDRLSRERVRSEMLKLLAATHAVPALVAMAECGILVMLLGGVPLLASFENTVKVEHAAGVSADPVRRLAALGAFLIEDAARLGEKLRLSNVEQLRIQSMADRWWRVNPADNIAARVLLYRVGPERFVDRVLLAWARSSAGAADPNWRTWALLPERWEVPVFPIKAADLIGRGVAQGPRLGIALRAAEEAWIAAGFPQRSEDLARLADEAATRLPA